MTTMGSGHLSALVDVAHDLTLDLPLEARLERLLAAVRQVVDCDAAALLATRGGVLVPVHVWSLRRETLGLTFEPSEHPRLAAIMASSQPVRFRGDDPRPDPFDGLIEGSNAETGRVHSCAGCSLRVGERKLGAITLEAEGPGRFDQLDLSVLRAFANLAATAMYTAELIEALEVTKEHQDLVAQHLVFDALERHGGRLLGMSPAMVELRTEIDTVASSELAVLVQGETGTGKELVARTLHASSRRSKQPLVHVNCAALPESIAESELFGHEKGAFTGATSRRPGKFELAHGATIFLDEIGELPMSIQPKLLRFLQFGEIQRVGADKVKTVNVRVIAATNRKLVEEVKQGRFRADLYHRLSVYPMFIPPLRERPEDILLLAGHLADRARLHLGLGRIRFTEAARRRLLSYHWPGNIRELEHVVTRGALRASTSGAGRRSLTMIDAHHVDVDVTDERRSTEGQPLAATPAAAPTSVGLSVPAGGLTAATESFQRALLERAVGQASGNWAAAARLLEVDRSNLYRLAKRLKMR